MSAGNFQEAVDFYTQAINSNPKNAVYFANRAAACSKMGNHNAAVSDAQAAVELDPKYSKAYSRLG